MIVNITSDGGIPVTPSNTTNDPAGPFAGLFVVNGGTVKFTDGLGNVVGPTDSVPAGTTISIKCVRVWATSTATVVGLAAVA